MDESYPKNPFERYADDIVIHCHSKGEAEQLLMQLERRMQMFELALHPEKTKIVYCKNDQRTEKHDEESFTFLSYSFQPRRKRDSSGGNKTCIIFAPAISSKAKTAIRESIRAILIPRWTDQTMEGFAKLLNPKIRGWVNYYTKFYRQEMLKVFCYLNERIRKWIKNKYKLTGNKHILAKYKAIQRGQPVLFYHWRLGIKV